MERRVTDKRQEKVKIMKGHEGTKSMIKIEEPHLLYESSQDEDCQIVGTSNRNIG